MIKRFITFAVDKAVLNHILFILMLIMAIFAYKSIPKEIFPPSSLDKIAISGGYPGASADILDKIAVKPIEDDLKNVENIGDLTTQIKNGFFLITADLKDGANSQIVLNDIKDVITNAKKDLPSDMDEPTAKVIEAKFPLLLIAISGNVSQEKLLKAAKKLKSRLSDIKDLASIDIRGDANKELKVELDYKKIEALNLNKQALYSAIANLSSIFPAGTIKNRGNKFYISTINGQKDIKKLKNTILTVLNKKVRLGDIANVSFGLSTPKQISNFNGKRNISLNITKSKNGNAIALSKEIKKILKEFQKEYKDIKFQVYTDTSLWIRNRINLVTSNIFFGLILVFISIFLSVNWKISTVVAMGIPTSFFIGLIAAEYLGYSINMLTMLGALLALGMLVDEAIVVAENIYRHLEMGKSPREAAIDGAVEMFPAVLTATATTVFAFLPLLIMSGKIGLFIKVLPVMITILLLSSLFEAFYFLPLHAKELFSIGKVSKQKESSRWKKIQQKYANLLYNLSKEKLLSVLVIAVFILGGTIGLIIFSKFELFPKFDAQQIYLSGEVNVNSNLEDTKKIISPLEKSLIKELNGTDVSSITSIIGIKFFPDNTFESGENLFHIFINLHERKPQNFFDKYINPYLSLEYDNSDMKREKSSFEILKQAQNIVKKFKSLKDKNGKPVFKNLSVYVPQTGVVSNDIDIGVVDNGKVDVDKAINIIKDKLSKINGVKSINVNKKLGPKEVKLQINSYGQELGFNEQYLVRELRGLFLDAEYGKMLDSVGIVRIRLKDKNRDKNVDLKNLYLSIPNSNKKVQLKDIANFIYLQSPLVLYKDNSKRVWDITAQTTKGVVTATEVMKKIKPILEKLKKEGYEFIIKGEEKANKQVLTEMKRAAIIAIFLIFISLVLMFNSLILSLITISVIPLSILGALIGLKVLGLNLSMPALMGIVGLAGVVVNDAIIMLDFIKDSKDTKEMSIKASTRIRPIFLTSITTVLGLFTLMFFASGQALILQPMAVTLGFGIAFATILNLIFIPLLFAVVYRIEDEESI